MRGKYFREYPIAREFLAEFLGTFMLVTFGDASVAQAVLGGSKAGGAITIAWGFGVGITMGVYVSGNISGGHINPAVSAAMSCLRKLPVKKLPVYMLGQYLGAFVASLFIYLIYMDALDNYDGGERMVEGATATAGIWATYPKPYVSTWTGLGDQIFASMLLMIGVLAVTDHRGMAPSNGLAPFIIGLVVFGISMTFGLNCAFAINPARDLAPRIFTSIAGWGKSPFSFRGYNWFWVPVVGPHVGALLGAGIYQLFIGLHYPTDDNYELQEVDPELQLSTVCLHVEKEDRGQQTNQPTLRRNQNTFTSPNTYYNQNGRTFDTFTRL